MPGFSERTATTDTIGPAVAAAMTEGVGSTIAGRAQRIGISDILAQLLGPLAADAD
jgi:hypothetical protein